MAIATLVVLVASLSYGYVAYTKKATAYPELRDIASHQRDFNELRDYFQDIAQKKGALYAYEILRRVDLPPKTDVHLLGHVIGDQLYKEYGKDAISYCTSEFRNACSHTVVVGLMLDYGEAAINDIQAACKKAPGGLGAYTMCFHGLGHGILAFTDYNLEKTIALCKKTATAEYDRQEFGQCVGGAVMETISGGGHNPGIWASMRPHYLYAADPLYPCDAAFMPAEVKTYCYSYITPHLIEVAGGDMNSPNPAVYPKAFSYCRVLAPNDPDRNTCVASFGKEILNYARQSDRRTVVTITDEEFERMGQWCALSGNEHDTTLCLLSVLHSIYWGGENEPQVSVRYCHVLANKNKEYGDACVDDLAHLMARYAPKSEEREPLCKLLPEDAQTICRGAK